MKLLIMAFSLISVSGIAQTIIGNVEKIEKDQLQIKGPSGIVTLQVDEKTTIQKLKAFHDLSPLKAGDEIRANYYGEEGRLTAVTISARIAFTGAIVESHATHIVVGVDPSTAGARIANVFVYIQSGTKLGASRAQLTVGKRVNVTGWDAGDGVVDADKVLLVTGDGASTTPSR